MINRLVRSSEWSPFGCCWIALKEDFIIEQADVDTAYLNADLDRVHYMRMPDGYLEYENGFLAVLYLLKSLCDLHQSGREWNKLIKEIFIQAIFTQAKTDPCLFIRKSTRRNFVLIYVDDLIITALTRGEIAYIKDILKAHFSITKLGDAKLYSDYKSSM
jgi:hypothetical protein